MNSANAFVFASSGSYTEQQMQNHANYVNDNVNRFKQMGGWLAEQANKTLEGFNNFFNSRSWELSKRLTNKDEGNRVGRFEIGYLGSVDGLQGATGFMRNYIMANPLVMEGYLGETLEGFGGDFAEVCTGVGAENPFYRKAMNGILNLETVEDKPVLRHTHYRDISGTELSFREREDIQKTWRASNHHLAKGLDITSPKGRKIEDPLVKE